jgi:putative membrane protein
MSKRERREPSAVLPIALLAIVAVLVAISGIHPKERLTWWMEVAPILLVAPILIATYRRARLTTLLYVLLAVHALVLLVGAHSTYAEVPLGYWVRDALSLERNHYDRLGHFMQGFVPVIAAREILVRWSPVRRGGWLWLCATSICLAASAFYELTEWWAALTTEGGAVAFLGTQGDVWDTQWDMFLCLCGALLSQALLGRVHDRALARQSGTSS